MLPARTPRAVARPLSDLDGEAAERIFAVRHSGRADRIRHEDSAPRAFGASPEADGFGSNVDAIANQFCENGIIAEDRAQDARLAMIERAHGVEGVRCANRSGGDGGAGLGGGGVRVAKRHADAAPGGVGDEVESAGQLRGNGHQNDPALGGFEDAVEEGGVGGEEVLMGLHAALDVREKWAFEVNSKRNGNGLAGSAFGDAAGIADEGGEGGNRAQDRVEGRGNGGGEISGSPVSGEEAADGGQGLGGGLHGIVTAGAVNMDVKKGRRERGRGEAKDAA